jgi:hypothetical protein
MNRRERKKMEKEFGITKAKKNMTREQRFETMRDNILQGKKMQEDMKEVRRVQEQGKSDEVASQRISSIATDLMINHDVPYVEAMEQAKELYKQEVESSITKE